MQRALKRKMVQRLNMTIFSQGARLATCVLLICPLANCTRSEWSECHSVKPTSTVCYCSSREDLQEISVLHLMSTSKLMPSVAGCFSRTGPSGLVDLPVPGVYDGIADGWVRLRGSIGGEGCLWTLLFPKQQEALIMTVVSETKDLQWKHLKGAEIAIGSGCMIWDWQEEN